MQKDRVTYLTNACGEDTGYGTIDLSDSDYAKVAFEEGPGCVIPYIVEIDGKKYVLGNLEVAFKDEFWGEARDDLDTEESVRAYCIAVCDRIRKELSEGEIMLPLDDGDPGRFVIGIAIPLDGLTDSEDTKEALKRAIGRFIDLPDLDEISERADETSVVAPGG